MVPQLHIHVIARFQEDAAWPRPVWGVGERTPYAAALRDERIGMLRAALGIA
jgi:diadenosine tetraphosphate (Ap4A) HIT family hydrolase